MAAPVSINSNAVGASYAEEATLKTLPGALGVDAVWYGLEPNSFPEFGAQFATVARSFITNRRQQAKGTITDLDAKGGLNVDLTQRNLTRLFQGFFFADALEKPATNPLNGAQVVFTSVANAGSQYNAAAGLGVFKVGHLVLPKNFGITGNNGLRKVASVAGTDITTDVATVDEAAPPAAATIEAVGFEFPAGDVALTIVGGTIVMTSATIVMTTLALNIGEWVYLGGDAGGTQFALNAPFFARIKQITATTIIFDSASKVVIADAGAAKTIRMFFGKVLMNAVLPANIKRRSYQVERTLGSDTVGDATKIQSEYLIGAVPNDLTFNLQQASKATCDLTFVAMDVEQRTGTDALKIGTRVASPFEDAINTSHDIIMSRLAIVDPTNPDPSPLFAYATDVKLEVKNGVTGNKALGVLGAFEANVADFTVSGTAKTYFSTVAAAQAIRNNADVNYTAAFGKKNAGILLDIPLLMLGGGLNVVEKDKPIMVDLTKTAAMNAAGYTLLMNVFEYLPTVAMPI